MRGQETGHQERAQCRDRRQPLISEDDSDQVWSHEEEPHYCREPKHGHIGACLNKPLPQASYIALQAGERRERHAPDDQRDINQWRQKQAVRKCVVAQHRRTQHPGDQEIVGLLDHIGEDPRPQQLTAKRPQVACLLPGEQPAWPPRCSHPQQDRPGKGGGQGLTHQAPHASAFQDQHDPYRSADHGADNRAGGQCTEFHLPRQQRDVSSAAPSEKEPQREGGQNRAGHWFIVEAGNWCSPCQGQPAHHKAARDIAPKGCRQILLVDLLPLHDRARQAHIRKDVQQAGEHGGHRHQAEVSGREHPDQDDSEDLVEPLRQQPRSGRPEHPGNGLFPQPDPGRDGKDPASSLLGYDHVTLILSPVTRRPAPDLADRPFSLD